MTGNAVAAAYDPCPELSGFPLPSWLLFRIEAKVAVFQGNFRFRRFSTRSSVQAVVDAAAKKNAGWRKINFQWGPKAAVGESESHAFLEAGARARRWLVGKMREEKDRVRERQKEIGGKAVPELSLALFEASDLDHSASKAVVCVRF